MISDFFPNKIYAEIIEISDFIFFALFWVPENAQTQKLAKKNYFGIWPDLRDLTHHSALPTLWAVFYLPVKARVLY